MALDRTFPFPPRSLGEWRGLSKARRRTWLNLAYHRFFDEVGPSARTPGRIITLDGSIVDGLLGFFCAIGEAVNGPGGYFGRTLHGFDDCLFSGFGLEFPYTIVWTHADQARRTLGSEALLEYLSEEATVLAYDELADRAALEEAERGARRGERTMFDEIIDAISTVQSRGGGEVTLTLQ